jgi:hypothetical protein
MIGTIRKHSSWLWWLIAGLTIISFVWFMGQGPTRNNRGGTGGDYGTIYNHVVTAQEYQRAKAGFFIYYWMRSNGQWPDKGGSYSSDDTEREVDYRLLLGLKAKQLDIHVSEPALVGAATEFLRSFGRNGQPMDINKFAEQYLAPENLGVGDLENFLRDELVVQQMIQVLGLSGALVTPQEAGQLYDREHQEVAAQAVFFNASNYLAQVTPTPDAVGQYYTNAMANYREPDRVQVSYVCFNVTNYLAQAKAEWAKTNFDEYVNAVYQQYGQSQFPDAKTPEEAKAKIRDLVVRQRALTDARQLANNFANAVFAIEPAAPENLANYAKTNGLVAQLTAPFDANLGPREFDAPAAFIKSAFELSPDNKFAGPIVGPDGVYVLAYADQLPSFIPPLAQIRNRVTQDFLQAAAVERAQQAGTNFYYSVATQMAAGNSFGKAVSANGQSPQLLPPFSLSSSDLPGFTDGTALNQLKQAAFTTTPGHVSPFQPTRTGGFVLFVSQLLPIDTTEKTAAMPKFLADVSRARQGEAFNMWLQGEANRELRQTPFYQKMLAGGAAKQP